MSKVNRVQRVIEGILRDDDNHRVVAKWSDKERKRAMADTKELLMQECGRIGEAAFLKLYAKYDKEASHV
jgi:hypothetical protein